ncbi:hypothetical protein MUY27_09985 [Mucilaginibacter sp. RS28]|uniref:Lipoprotein n=1 Tax=Mucilaginibacter straminoryzae TaxID=2932774 RepID=A0A9X1X2Z0_9SPHI|nr:hypothetical protein [Mucilaginibacter straminoryzae]MCJ8210038.1 hypothetical protein [Mucilaginibacter straminoryzae]
MTKTKFFLFLSVVLFFGCKKDTNVSQNVSKSTENDKSLILDAKNYFEKEILFKSNNSTLTSDKSFKTYRQLQDKIANFDSAFVQESISKQKYVTIPIKYPNKELYCKAIGKTWNLSSFTYLIFYLDKKSKKHVELITKFPSDSYLVDTSKSKKLEAIS